MNRKEARFREKLLRYKGPKRLQPARRKPVSNYIYKPWAKEHAGHYQPLYFKGRELDV
jgi:hypothetical protein